MNAYLAMLLGWSTAGAALAQTLQYYYIRRLGLRFDFPRGGIIAMAAGLGSSLYFLYIDDRPAPPMQALQYGLFLALTIEEILAVIDKMQTAPTEPERQPKVALTVGSTPASGALMLSGLLPVYGVACFGALIAEFTRIRSGRKKLSQLTTNDWGLSVFFILASGIVAVLHGYTNVNALTVLQLGAAGPLVIKRVR